MAMLVAVTCLARRRRIHSRGSDAAPAALELEQMHCAPLNRRRRAAEHASSGREGRGRLPHGRRPAPDSGRRRIQAAATERAPEVEEAPAAVAASEESPASASPSSEASSSLVLCVVCLEEVMRPGRGSEAAEATTLPCSHSYHPACVLPWLAAHDDCPCCRAAAGEISTLKIDGV